MVAGMLVWMPSNSGGLCRAICSETAFPQSPPCATYRVYPRRFISTIQARGKRIDDLQLLDDRAGPPVRDDERQRILMFRTNVDEMNVEPIDLGHELREGVQLRLALAPIIIRRPIARECLSRRQLHALRCIRDRFP